jgi:hypothetical protein
MAKDDRFDQFYSSNPELAHMNVPSNYMFEGEVELEDYLNSYGTASPRYDIALNFNER